MFDASDDSNVVMKLLNHKKIKNSKGMISYKKLELIMLLYCDNNLNDNKSIILFNRLKNEKNLVFPHNDQWD